MQNFSIHLLIEFRKCVMLRAVQFEKLKLTKKFRLNVVFVVGADAEIAF